MRLLHSWASRSGRVVSSPRPLGLLLLAIDAVRTAQAQARPDIHEQLMRIAQLLADVSYHQLERSTDLPDVCGCDQVPDKTARLQRMLSLTEFALKTGNQRVNISPYASGLFPS